MTELLLVIKNPSRVLNIYRKFLTQLNFERKTFMANFTQGLIYDTFLNMLDRMSFDKITVTSLIKECNISRNTFYYHYEDIYDLLDDVLISLIKKYDQETAKKDLKEVLKSMLYDCRENGTKVYNIFNSISRDRLERYIFDETNSIISHRLMKIAKEKNVNLERAQAITDIVRYSIYGFFMEFLWNGMKDDIEESVDNLVAIYNELLEKMLY